MSAPRGDVPTSTPDRARRLAEIILAESRRAGGGPGTRLPTERQLAIDLGTSRASVRYALAVLEAEGHISREVGRGTFLRDARNPTAAIGGPLPGGTVPASMLPDGPGLWDGAGPSGPADRSGADGPADGPAPRAGPDAGHPAEPATAAFAPADVMTIRRLLEPPAMRLVVAWARASDFREMERCLAGAAQAARHEDFELWDLALHRAIMAASHSPLLIRLYAVVDAARHGQSWGDLKRRTTSPPRQREYQADHRELVDALRARDADRAVEAMRAHVARITSTLFDGAS